LEEEDEDEVYTSLCIRNHHGGKLQDEDDMIENLIQNPPLSVLPLEDIVMKTPKNPSTGLCVADLTSLCVRTIQFSPKRTLKTNPSISSSEEKEL